MDRDEHEDGAAGSTARGPAGRRRRPIDAATRERIGRGLRLRYAEVLALPIPERLRALVDDLARADPPDAPAGNESTEDRR